MAIPEACGLWIEQRLKEEIEETGDTMKSVRAIARDVTDEVNRVFETNINPETINKRAQRIKKKTGTNVPDTPTARNDEETGGDSGDKPTIEKATQVMNQEVEKGKSTREAAKLAAEKTGQKADSVRKAHQRAEKKKGTPARDAKAGLGSMVLWKIRTLLRSTKKMGLSATGQTAIEYHLTIDMAKTPQFCGVLTHPKNGVSVSLF